MKKRILYIGSINDDKQKGCGQLLKTQIIRNILEKEGFVLDLVDLSKFTKNPFKQIHQIKKKMKVCDFVFAIPGPRAAHIILPLLARLNKRYKKNMIYCAIGAGYISEYITNKNPNFFEDFLTHKKEMKGKKRDTAVLSSFNYILLETELLCKIHTQYYGIGNCALYF